MALSYPPTLLYGRRRNPSPAARTLPISDLSAAAPPLQHQLHSELALKPPPLSSIFIKPSKPHHSKLANTTVKSLFTGIVEEMGTIKHLGFDQFDSFTMKIQAKTVLEGVHLGDSIAVNGTCLTVTEFDIVSSEFSVGLAPETLRKTSLGELENCSLVNLERALSPSTRMGGHFVQGHVDGTGEIVELKPDGDSLWVKVKVGREILRYIVPKGFIAVDGMSLTVVDVFDDEGCFAADTRDGIRLIFQVEQNQEFQGLVCEGANVLPTKFIEDAFRDGYGTVVNVRRLDEVINSIDNWYMERGLFGMVSGVEILSGGIIKLKASEAEVNDISIRFLDKTGEPTVGKARPETILRQLTTKKGQVYSMIQGKRDVDIVLAMGVMDDVSIIPQSSSEIGKVDLTMNVVERKSGGGISGGGGISSGITSGPLAGLIGSISNIS